MDAIRTLTDITLSRKDREAIQAAARVLFEQCKARQVILFGSKARGDDRADSDIDLLVLVDEPVTHALKRSMTDALFDVELRYDVVISKLVVSQDDWLHGMYRVLPIHQAIEQEGVAA